MRALKLALLGALLLSNAVHAGPFFPPSGGGGGGSGTVTSVGQTFSDGLLSVSGSPITTSGTLGVTVAGTSGGVPYFNSATTWATSAALAANALVIGGGAGAAPATTTTGTGVVTALGVAVGSAGAFVVNGGALGTPSGGTLTNATGLPISTGVSGLGTGVATLLGGASSGTGGPAGTVSPTFTSLPIINNNTAAPTAALGGAVLQLNGVDASNTLIELDAYAGGSIFAARRADGTGASPTAVQANDSLLTISARGFDGSAYSAGSNAAIQAFAAETFTTSAHGTQFKFTCTTPTTLTTTTCATLTSTGFNSTAIGATTASTGAFTTLTASTSIFVSAAGSAAAPTLAVGNSTTGFYSVSTTGLAASLNGVLLFDYGITSAGRLSIAHTIQATTGNVDAASDVGEFGIGAAVDTLLGRRAANSLLFGGVDIASPSAQTIGSISVVTGTSNTAAPNFTVTGSQSTGSGTSGDIILQTGGTGAASTTKNTLTTALTIKGATQEVVFGGVPVSAGTAPVGTTGSCVASSFAGGTTAGTFSAAVCSAGTIILSSMPAAPTGYACNAIDRTTSADTLTQTASSTTSATFKATTVASDVVQFQCWGY